MNIEYVPSPSFCPIALFRVFCMRHLCKSFEEIRAQKIALEIVKRYQLLEGGYLISINKLRMMACLTPPMSFFGLPFISIMIFFIFPLISISSVDLQLCSYPKGQHISKSNNNFKQSTISFIASYYQNLHFKES